MADSRDDLRKQIGTRPAGGVVFTTIQKFQLDEKETKFPALTERRNVFVFTDEDIKHIRSFKKENTYSIHFHSCYLQ